MDYLTALDPLDPLGVQGKAARAATVTSRKQGSHNVPVSSVTFLPLDPTTLATVAAEPGLPRKHEVTNRHRLNKHNRTCPARGRANRSRSRSDGTLPSARQSFWNLSCCCNFTILPDEIVLFDVFTFLQPAELGVLAGVCKRFQFVSTDRVLWSQLDFGRIQSALVRRAQSNAKAQPTSGSPENKNVGALGVTEDIVRRLVGRYGHDAVLLKLCNCHHIGGQLLGQLPRMLPRLVELHLCNLVSVTDQVLSAFARSCGALEHVSVFGCLSITDVSVKDLVARTRNTLRELSLRGCRRVTAAALDGLSPSLLGLNLAGCKKVSKSLLAALAQNTPRLQRLNLHGIRLDDEAIVKLTEGCPQLETVHFSNSNPFGGGSSLSDTSMQALARCVKLSCVNVQGASNITDDGIEALVSSATRLQRLNIGGCYRVTDAGVAAVAKHCTELTHFSVFQCFKVTDTAVASLASLERLQHLDLHSCMGLTGRTTSIAAGDGQPEQAPWPELQSLDIGSCRKIATDAVTSLREARPLLTVVFY